VKPWFPELNFERVLAIALVHDLGEAVSGDISAVLQVGAPPKLEQERRDLLQLLEDAPAAVRANLVALFDEYNAAATPEAKFVKAFDKLETILQHNQGNRDSRTEQSARHRVHRPDSHGLPRFMVFRTSLLLDH